MRFNKPTSNPAGESSGGVAGIPSWRQKWIEEKVRKVQASCGCEIDISDKALTFINSFKGAQVDCSIHERFVDIIEPVRKERGSTTPNEPLF